MLNFECWIIVIEKTLFSKTPKVLIKEENKKGIGLAVSQFDLFVSFFGTEFSPRQGRSACLSSFIRCESGA